MDLAKSTNLSFTVLYTTKVQYRTFPFTNMDYVFIFGFLYYYGLFLWGDKGWWVRFNIG